MRTGIAGEAGLVKLTAAIVGVFVLMSLVAGLWSQWIWGVAGVIVGWQAVRAINR
jgi:hypothetical protein